VSSVKRVVLRLKAAAFALFGLPGVHVARGLIAFVELILNKKLQYMQTANFELATGSRLSARKFLLPPGSMGLTDECAAQVTLPQLHFSGGPSECFFVCVFFDCCCLRASLHLH